MLTTLYSRVSSLRHSCIVRRTLVRRESIARDRHGKRKTVQLVTEGAEAGRGSRGGQRKQEYGVGRTVIATHGNLEGSAWEKRAKHFEVNM